MNEEVRVNEGEKFLQDEEMPCVARNFWPTSSKLMSDLIFSLTISFFTPL
jgi:hypothetical protein